MTIRLKRAYDEPAANDGYRVLVDRVWPRGVKKEEARLDDWLKEIAPTRELRKWFGHDPQKWPEFLERYSRELKDHPELLDRLARLNEQGRLTLVFGAKDREHNNAVALKEFLRERQREKK